MHTHRTLDYTHIVGQLNASLYGLDKEKEELLSYLKITELNKYALEKIACLSGPPGVGKKSLIHALAKALNRKCIHIKLATSNGTINFPIYGKSKAGEIAGHVIHLMNQHRDQDVLFLLEDIDSLTLTFQNKITYQFKEILTITNDHALRMKHIDEPLDFTRVLFFATVNDASRINHDLFTQLEIIPISGYSDEQKIAIAQRWIIPEESKACGVQSRMHISDDMLYEIIIRYTNEIGLHQLRGVLKKLCKRMVLELALSNGQEVPEIDAQNLSNYLGPPLCDMRKAREENEVGVISTIGRSDGHGVIADLEVLLIEDEHPRILLTGNMDNLLREVVMVAISYLLSQYKTLGLEKDFNKKYTIHVNMIPGGILKSGVSAGLSVVLALISALTNREIRCDTSALGEITLHGKVKKVIGVHEKILGASRLGLKRIIFSRENAQDIERLPQEIRADLELLCVTTITEAAHYTFQ